MKLSVTPSTSSKEQDDRSQRAAKRRRISLVQELLKDDDSAKVEEVKAFAATTSDASVQVPRKLTVLTI